ncbi:MAG: rRNA cytosine-C5-methyltransferase [Muribaculaceae bacterium]|nr:rRNA cytosine-C5-methyltransferase [Muribaculaceae bacterium]
MLSKDFIALLKSYPTDIFNRIEGDLASRPTVAVRVNPLKGVDSLDAQKPVPWALNGFYLTERFPFTFDSAFHQGLYYVQDASSMIIGRIIKQITDDGVPVTYLDACAAPGGKTTAAISALPSGSVVVANEYEPRRVAPLCENLMKWGYPSTIVTAGDTRQFRCLQGFFDIIAADVPCSGEGMMRKDEEAVEQWSRALVDSCAERQREIVDNLVDALRPGGYLIYSTCTFNRVENEEIVDYICSHHGFESVEINVPLGCGIDDAIDSPHYCRRFIPGRVCGEGLFIALLKKPGEPKAEKPQKTKPQSKKNADKGLTALLNGDFDFSTDKNDIIHAFPSESALILAAVEKATKVVTYGVEIGQRKGKDVVYLQGLAMSAALNGDAFPQIDIDISTAVSYLQRNTLTLPDNAPRGIVLLRFGGHPLGFVKNLGNRANNLYPQSMRILSQHLPDELRSLLG